MKTVNKLLIGLALAGGLLTACSGDYYVTDQPAEPVYSRPAAPYDGAVWVSGDWVWNGGRYVYRNGYYARPRSGRAWVAGSWERSNRGYHWRRGHWR